MSEKNSKANLKVLPHRRNTHNIRVFKFTDLQVEAAKLRAQGYTLTQIADKLKRKPHHISKALREFWDTAMYMRLVLKELSRLHYFDVHTNRSNFPARVRSIKEEKIRQGKWPFSPHNIPLGFKLSEDRTLQVNADKVAIVRRIFERVINGERPLRVGEEEGLKRARTVFRILRNPIYIGYIRFGGKLIKAKYEPLIDEETWNQAQEILHELKVEKPPSTPLFGFRRVGAKIIVDQEKSDIIKKIFQLRLQRKSIGEIGAEVKMPAWKVHAIIRNPAYKAIVGEELWLKTCNIRVTQKELQEKRTAKIDAKILLCLHESPRKTGEIMRVVGLPRASVKSHLRMLKLKGLVEREEGRFGRWKIKA